MQTHALLTFYSEPRCAGRNIRAVTSEGAISVKDYDMDK